MCAQHYSKQRERKDREIFKTVRETLKSGASLGEEQRGNNLKSHYL